MLFFKRFVYGFIIFHSIFLSTLFIYRFINGGTGDSNEIFVYIILLLSYIPLLAILSYFIFYYTFGYFRLNPKLKIFIVAILTSIFISLFLELQLNDRFFTINSFISAFIMSLILPIFKNNLTKTKWGCFFYILVFILILAEGATGNRYSNPLLDALKRVILMSVYGIYAYISWLGAWSLEPLTVILPFL